LNTSRFNNAKLDQALVTASTTTDRERRKVAYAEVQRILADEVPEVFAFYRPIPLGHSANIEGIVTSAGRPYLNVAKWSLRP
jgi:ABC-type transport system substrate-binding protein